MAEFAFDVGMLSPAYFLELGFFISRFERKEKRLKKVKDKDLGDIFVETPNDNVKKKPSAPADSGSGEEGQAVVKPRIPADASTAPESRRKGAPDPFIDSVILKKKKKKRIKVELNDTPFGAVTGSWVEQRAHALVVSAVNQPLVTLQRAQLSNVKLFTLAAYLALGPTVSTQNFQLSGFDSVGELLLCGGRPSEMAGVVLPVRTSCTLNAALRSPDCSMYALLNLVA